MDGVLEFVGQRGFSFEECERSARDRSDWKEMCMEGEKRRMCQGADLWRYLADLE